MAKSSNIAQTVANPPSLSAIRDDDILTVKTIAALEGITPARVIVFLHMGRLKEIRRCRKWEITGKAY